MEITVDELGPATLWRRGVETRADTVPCVRHARPGRPAAVGSEPRGEGRERRPGAHIGRDGCERDRELADPRRRVSWSDIGSTGEPRREERGDAALLAAGV